MAARTWILLVATGGLTMCHAAPLRAQSSAAQQSRQSAQEGWMQAYQDGLDAYKKNDLATAEQRFKEALRLDPRQARRKRFYSNIVNEYVPEYYLALIYARTNRAAEAQKLRESLAAAKLITADQSSQITSLIPQQVEEPRWARAYREGEQALPAGDLSTAEARFKEALQLDSAQSTTKQFGAGATGPYVPELYLAELYARTNRASEAQALRDKLAAASLITPAQQAAITGMLPKPAPRWATAYGEGLAAYRSEDLITAQARFSEALRLDGVQSRRKTFPDGTISEYVPEFFLAQIYARSNRAGEAQDIQQRLSGLGLITAEQSAALTSLLPAAATSASNTGTGGPAGGNGTRGTPSPQTGDSSPPVTPAERRALQALLSGDYQAALRISTQNLKAPSPSARLLYYAAWSNAALGLLTGGADGQRLIATARQQFARARSSNPNGFLAESRYVSPKVLDALSPRTKK